MAGLQRSPWASIPNTCATNLPYCLKRPHQFIYFGLKEASAKPPPEDKSLPARDPIMRRNLQPSDRTSSSKLGTEGREHRTRFGRGQGAGRGPEAERGTRLAREAGPSWALRGGARTGVSWKQRRQHEPLRTPLTLTVHNAPGVTAYVCEEFSA